MPLTVKCDSDGFHWTIGRRFLNGRGLVGVGIGAFLNSTSVLTKGLLTIRIRDLTTVARILSGAYAGIVVD